MFTVFYAVVPTLIALMLFPAAFVPTGGLSVSSDALSSSIISSFASLRAFAVVDTLLLAPVLVAEPTRTTDLPFSTVSAVFVATQSPGASLAVCGVLALVLLTATLVLCTPTELPASTAGPAVVFVTEVAELASDDVENTFIIPETACKDALLLETAPFTYAAAEISFFITDASSLVLHAAQFDDATDLFDLSLPAIPLSSSSSFGQLLDFAFADESVVFEEADTVLLAEPAPFNNTLFDSLPIIADPSSFFIPSGQASELSALLDASLPLELSSFICSLHSILLVEAAEDLLNEVAPFTSFDSFDASFVVPEQIFDRSALLDLSLPSGFSLTAPVPVSLPSVVPSIRITDATFHDGDDTFQIPLIETRRVDILLRELAPTCF